MIEEGPCPTCGERDARLCDCTVPKMMQVTVGDRVLTVPQIDDEKLAEVNQWREDHASSPMAIAADVVAREVFKLPPFVPGSATSHAAAEQIKPHLTPLQQRVYEYVRAHPGCTDEQIAAGTGLKENTVRPRRVELARDGRILLNRAPTILPNGRKAQTWRVATQTEQGF